MNGLESNAEEPATTAESLSAALRRLTDRGYVADLVAVDGGLRNPATGDVHRIDTLRVDDIVRFEGATNPDDEAIVVAVSLQDGTPLGSFTAPYGPQASHDEASVLRGLRARP